MVTTAKDKQNHHLADEEQNPHCASRTFSTHEFKPQTGKVTKYCIDKSDPAKIPFKRFVYRGRKTLTTENYTKRFSLFQFPPSNIGYRQVSLE